MANADTPRGLRPVMHQSGAPWNGAANKYYVPSTDNTAIYVGGLVKLAGSADANGIASVTGNVATGDAVVGVVIGVVPDTADSLRYRAASTERYVLVADDPDLMFLVQDDAAATPTVANVGNSADLTGFTSGSTTTALSSIEISASTLTASGDGTQDVVIWGLYPRVDNEVGDNADWLVRLNNHSRVDGYAGA